MSTGSWGGKVVEIFLRIFLRVFQKYFEDVLFSASRQTDREGLDPAQG